MRRFLLLSCAWIVWLAGFFICRADNLERALEGNNVKATLSSPFSALPPSGCVPFRVTIRNDGNTPGTWHITFEGGANVYMRGMGSSLMSEDVTVKANASDSFDFMVPLTASTDRSHANSLQVGITGPGFGDSGLEGRNLAAFINYGAEPQSPFTLVGSEILGPSGTGWLETWYKNRRQAFAGSAVDASALPSDWRAYSGVAAICLKDSEWLALSAVQHDALCDYVAQGGELLLFSAEDTGARATGLRLPQSDGNPGAYGLGYISLATYPTLPIDPQILDTEVKRHRAPAAENIDQNFSTWDLRKQLGSIQVSGAFILCFVLLFGTLVGPVNMFVFAKGRQRFRLFWTTPLISILASLSLMAGILLTDGLGGSGRQMIVIYSLPDANREVVVQEQVARTGLLFHTGWHSDQHYLITPVSDSSMGNAMYRNGAYAGRSDGLEENFPNKYVQSGGTYAGNWFRSREVSGQYLQAVRPSRSTLTVLNPGGFNSGQEPPVLLSSFPQELSHVYLIDPQGHFWTCENLEPGVKKSGAPSSGIELNRFWTDVCGHAGGKLRPALSRIEKLPGFFFASGIPPESDRLNTLDEIRWQVASGIYLGPWVAAPATENTP